MADKVKPLKIESPSTGGTQDDLGPTEMNPSQDYASVKGIAFEGAETAVIDANSGTLRFKDASNSTAINLTNAITSVTSFGRAGGNISVGSYLNFEGVPSNAAGSTLLSAHKVIAISVATNGPAVLNTVLQIQRRTALGILVDIAGASVTLLATEFRKTVTGLSVALSAGDELACYIKSGSSLSNPVVQVFHVPSE
jgi:hypothetical protein